MSPRIQRRSLTVRYADYKALVNNSDFKCFLEVGSEPLSLCWAGNEFHTVGAATERARSVRVRWVCRCRVSTDRDEREDVTGWSRSDRYDSVEDARILYVRCCDVCFMVRIRVTSHWRVSSPGSMGNGIGSTQPSIHQKDMRNPRPMTVILFNKWYNMSASSLDSSLPHDCLLRRRNWRLHNLATRTSGSCTLTYSTSH